MVWNAKKFQPFLVAFLLLFVVASTINQRDQEDFNLQQIGVESLVERGTFALEGSSVPQLQPRGDTFTYANHLYAIKQPGQFVAGAAAYAVIRLFGITYAQSYVLTASLVTLFTSGLAVVGIGLLLYSISEKVFSDSTISVVVAVVGVAGTMLLPYGGVSHHDTLAAAVLFAAFYLRFIRMSKDKMPWQQVFFSGFLLSATLFFSMLPAAVVAMLLVAGLLLDRQIPKQLYLLGFLIGMLPLLAYNLVLFNQLFSFPNTASGASDTYPFFSIENTVEKIRFYLFSPASSLFYFSPVLLLGVLGWFWSNGKLRRIGLLAASVVAVHLLYISSIETFGHAQYGPRYMLPIIPYFMVGLIGLMEFISRKQFTMQAAAWVSICVLGIVGILINWTGGVVGVMYNEITVHPFPEYLQQFAAGDHSALVFTPVASWGLVLTIGFVLISCMLLFVRKWHKKSRLPLVRDSFGSERDPVRNLLR